MYRLPGFSDFLLVGLTKIGTVGPDFQASQPQLTGFSALARSTGELQNKKIFFHNFILSSILDVLQMSQLKRNELNIYILKF